MTIEFIKTSIEGYIDVYSEGMKLGQISMFRSGKVTFKGIEINELEQILDKMKELREENHNNVEIAGIQNIQLISTTKLS